MNIYEVREFADKLKSRLPNGGFSYIEQQTIRDIYAQMFGRQLRQGTCKNIYSDALIEIRIAAKNTDYMERKYKLKRGVVIKANNGRYYNLISITDEIAAAYLAENPSEADKFEQIPEAEETIEKTPEKAAKTIKKIKK